MQKELSLLQSQQNYQRIATFLIVAFLTLFSVLFIIFVSQSNQKVQTYNNKVNAQASTVLSTTDRRFYGVQLYLGYINKGSMQPISLTGGIYTGTGAPDIPVGAIVAVGISTVGTGEITLSDSRNNSYQMVKKQAIDSSSSTVLFTSTLTSALKAYDKMTINTTSAKSIAVSALAFYGPTGVYQTEGLSGNNTSPQGPTIITNSNDFVIVVAGFRAKSGDFSMSYDPIVQTLTGSDSGTTGNSLDNSMVELAGYISSVSGPTSITVPISDLKNKKGVPWGSIATSFH